MTLTLFIFLMFVLIVLLSGCVVMTIVFGVAECGNLATICVLGALVTFIAIVAAATAALVGAIAFV